MSQGGSRRARSWASYNRQGPRKKQKKTILIVCEGEKTEQIYFNFLKDKLNITSFNIRVIGEAPETLTLVEMAIAERNKRSKDPINDVFDDIWCVSDVEMPVVDKSITKAFKLARKNKIKIALSNPCFEYWYVLHFAKISPKLSNKQMIRKVKSYFPKYDKSEVDICECIFAKRDDAIELAKVLKTSNKWSTDLRKNHPSTHVYRVVEKLIKISKMK